MPRHVLSNDGSMHSFISIQPYRPGWQEPEPSHVTGMALAHCILGKCSMHIAKKSDLTALLAAADTNNEEVFCESLKHRTCVVIAIKKCS